MPSARIGRGSRLVCATVLLAPSLAFAAAPPALTGNCSGLYGVTGVAPPDPSGAVGPNRLYEFTGQETFSQTLACGQNVSSSLSDFFSLASANVERPRIVYDPYTPGFLTAAITYDKDPDTGAVSNAAILLSASPGTSADTPLRHPYRFDLAAGERAGTVTLGFDKDWVVVSSRIFQTAAPGSELRREIHVLSKDDLFTGVPLASLRKKIFTVNGPGTDVVPAITYDPTVAALYLLENVGGDVAGNGTLALYVVTGAVGSESFGKVADVTTPNTWTSTGPSDLANLGDDGMQEVIYRAGSVWAAHTVFLPSDAPDHSEVQWWQISSSGATVQRGRVSAAPLGGYVGFPSLAVNANRDVMIGFSIDSFVGDHFPAGYVFRTECDPPGTTSDVAIYKASVANPLLPWGQYSATAVGPNDLDFWTLQEWGSADDWGTWWGGITRSAVLFGDVNHDGMVDVADVFYLINFLFAGGPSPTDCAADVNADMVANVADVFYLINFLFAGGPAPH